ncbi:MAG TPA: serine hydrolase [Thermomicrobiales bacterium]|nr:serine hydrolase [Thermomicrobiales bacterium]
MRQSSHPAPLLPRILVGVIAFMTVLVLAAPQLGAAAPGVGWASIDQQFSQIAPGNNLLVAEFSGNGCRTIHAVNADTQLAIASTFKIYVLGEVARQVQAGEVAWDDPITLTESLRSMPSGDFAWARTGQQVTVRQLAEAMMWHSDNTATDHLIDHLGRENVERSFAAYGHADPGANVPLLLTRELFAIKMWQPEAWMTQYVAASNQEQLALLSSDISGVHLDPSGGWGKWNGPTAIEGIEWFASAEDLCRVMVGLWTMGAQPGLEPVREILSGNRGGIVDTGLWPHVGFKAGYEAGVVNSTYVLERNDGRVFFVSAGFNHPTGVVDQGAPAAVLGPVFTCLATYQQDGDCAA